MHLGDALREHEEELESEEEQVNNVSHAKGLDALATKSHGETGTGYQHPKRKQVKEEVYRDDLTGQPLNPALVKAARRNELDYFNSKGVWEKCRWQESL